ncbi:type III-B CRISPR module-associated protein Cmr5 [Myxococcota bacterium]
MTPAEEARDLTLLRTRHCYDEVRSWHQGWRKEAAQRVKGLPIAIRMQGLMVVLATLMREDSPYARRLADALAQWLMVHAPNGPLRGHGVAEAGPRQLLDACRNASRAEFLAAEWEAVLFFDHVELYADAMSAAEKW